MRVRKLAFESDASHALTLDSEAVAMSRKVFWIVVAVGAALLVLSVLFGIMTFAVTGGSNESPVIVPAASPPPTVAQ